MHRHDRTIRFVLFPAGTVVHPSQANEDTVEDVGLYQIVDTASDFIVGEIGISAPEEKGLDALWAWQGSNGERANRPFLNPSDALDNFLEEVEI